MDAEQRARILRQQTRAQELAHRHAELAIIVNTTLARTAEVLQRVKNRPRRAGQTERRRGRQDS
jgi:hypothetical protein